MSFSTHSSISCKTGKVCGRWDNNPIPEKFIVKKPPEPMLEDHGRGKDARMVVAPIQKKT
jgi:hypothetical protein